jgi:hypothetical protein
MEERARLAHLSRMQEDLRAYVGIVLVRTKARRLNYRAATQRSASLVDRASAIEDADLVAATQQLWQIPVTCEEFDFPGSTGPARVREARLRIEACLERLRSASLTGIRSGAAATFDRQPARAPVSASR